MENVLVKVGTILYLVEFLIVDIEEKVKVPIILYKPLLCTTRENENMENGELGLILERKDDN